MPLDFVQLLRDFGFPIVAFFAILFITNRAVEKNTKAVDKLAEKLDKLTNLIYWYFKKN